jgi:hypothetical protein
LWHWGQALDAMTDDEKENTGGTAAPDSKADKLRKAEEAFVRGLVERGQAAKADENGNLPPGATHEIVGVSESGVPIVVRRRFA